jgi:hypothetical protein
MYAGAAERNIRSYYLGVLWDIDAQAVRDHPSIPSFVPNKAATWVEALIKLAQLSGDEAWIEMYALPTLEAVLAHQVQGGPMDGAICQYSQEGRMVQKFFTLYVARCVPGLVAGYIQSGQERFLDAALRAMAFVLHWRRDDGSFPQVVYPGGRTNRYPQWVAGVGDILRAMHLLEPYGLDVDLDSSLAWLLRGQESTGGFRTARGFASQIGQRQPGAVPEFRDILPVCGWNDKAWRYLTEALDPECRPFAADGHWQPKLVAEYECTFRGQLCLYREDQTVIELQRKGTILYRWRKGAAWAEVCAPEVLWK